MSVLVGSAIVLGIVSVIHILFQPFGNAHGITQSSSVGRNRSHLGGSVHDRDAFSGISLERVRPKLADGVDTIKGHTSRYSNDRRHL